ncbi:hypothetical protein GCM10007962_02850 [Yeosuana aromativorans]|uniref:Pesticidal crystal protein Cry22Aa Ig-like domain-containing protein n=1 Tax=Yeosuana aromativorans TaxID=288019 RepID=A0A8J3FDA2_9FLAO|nr:immunoglobulin-like domain-containing protein [Yeosuana aromativorans]GGK12020.1 hypothetical protein GCM10007962_02850 [Yeosuana aromativorans]
MKNIFKIMICVALLILSSCDTESTADVSEVTNYAVIELNGSDEVIINQGDAWTDPSANVTLSGEPYPFTTSTVVDTNVPGVYYITYEAVNDLGFAASATRTVVVVSTAPSIYNLEGSWARSNGSPGTCTKISDRYYTYDNAGGVTGANQATVTFINVNDDEIYIPYQENTSPSGISIKSFLPGHIDDNDNFRWQLQASAFYGTFERTFSRQ